MHNYMVAGPIRSGKLVRLFADRHHPERTPAFAVFPPGTQKVPKVRAFLDYLIERSFGVPGRYRKR
jgi:DNA-binding transcriptional LysR family regulator